MSKVVLGIDLPAQVTIGPRLHLHHGTGTVVRRGSRIGADVTLRHCSTVGAGPAHLVPDIRDGVELGANVVIFAGITIGAGCRVGAGAVVTKSVAPGTTVIGVPARPLHSPEPIESVPDF